MFIEKRSFIEKCLTQISSKIYKLRNMGGGLFSITVLQLITNHFSQTSFHYPSPPIYIFMKYRLNRLLLELRGLDFIIYKLANKRTEILAIATSNKAHIYITNINMLLQMLIFMPRFKSIIFIKIGLKLSYFCQKNTNFSSAEGSAPRPPCLQRLGALPDQKYAKQICATSRRLIINIPNFEIRPIESLCL